MAMNDINDAEEDRERKRLGMDWGQYNAFKFGEMHAARALTEIIAIAGNVVGLYDSGASRGKQMKLLRKIILQVSKI